MTITSVSGILFSGGDIAEKAASFRICREKALAEKKANQLLFIVRHLNAESAPIEAAGDDDDSSYGDKDEVVHAIMCSNVNCSTYEKEYTFEELQMKEAPSGDWFCSSCSDLDSTEVYVKSSKKVEKEQAEVAEQRPRRKAYEAANQRLVAATDDSNDDETCNFHAGSTIVSVVNQPKGKQALRRE